MSTNFLPPPPTNETLVADEFRTHIVKERRERRRLLPRRIAWHAMLALGLSVIMAISIWIAFGIGDVIEAHGDDIRAAITDK
jgi:hypothetical protein